MRTMTLEEAIEKYETDSAELMKVGAVEPAEEKQLIADLLNELLTPELQTTVLLETMAGKGSEVGGRFEELAAIHISDEKSVRKKLHKSHIIAISHLSGFGIKFNFDNFGKIVFRTREEAERISKERENNDS